MIRPRPRVRRDVSIESHAMPKSIAEMPPQLRDEVWKIAGQVEWTVEDWRDFHNSLTLFFARVAGRHAKAKIEAADDKSLMFTKEVSE